MNRSSDSYILFLLAVGQVIGYVLIVALASFFLMLAWNNVMPQVFHLITLNFGQAFCLGYVARTLLSQGVKNEKKYESTSVGSSSS